MNLKSCVVFMLFAVFLTLQACNSKSPLSLNPKKCAIPDQLCDSALLVVGNKTNSTIHFNKGESGTGVQYYLSVKPGQTTSFYTSGIDVRFDGDCDVTHFRGPIQGLQIPSMYFSVKINRCTKNVFFYTNSNNDIRLEIEDED